MGLSNSGDCKMFFGTNLSTLNIGLTQCGRAQWQEEEEAARIDFNIVLIHQDKKFFIFECEKGELGQGARLLSWRSASG